jgi:putative tryptophan/tyrosine transport system substrate-binding protein
MRRREVVALLASAVYSLGSRAAADEKLRRIGILRIGAPPPSFIEPLREGLRRLGYVEGQNIVIEYGIAESVEELPRLAADLIRRNIDILIASGTPAVVPARNATQTIPAVFIAALDPVATGVVASLARPGGNVTGLTALFADLTGKRLELLKEVFPSLSSVAFLSRATNPGHEQYVKEAEVAARKLNVQVQTISVKGPDHLEEAFRTAERAEAVVQIDDAMFTAHRRELVRLALLHRLPGIYGPREFVDLGGFAALGPSYSDLYLRAATYIDRILKGAKPADLPVEQPTKFELVINLQTAKALGITIPPTLLARADEVIE